MEEDQYSVNNNITSFLIECLLWNTPDQISNNYPTWENSLLHLFTQTADETWGKNWTEISGLLLLFSDNRKWKTSDVNDSLRNMWAYLDLK
jgi:hypothetical protein